MLLWIVDMSDRRAPDAASRPSFEVIVREPIELAQECARRIDGLSRSRPCAIALPGGSVAVTFFPVFAGAELNWANIQLFWCDERAVSPDHPDSNYRIAAEQLLAQVSIPERNVHRMAAEATDLERAAEAYERELGAVLGDPARMDVALLGMGPDGHVCSLFPGHAALDERRRPVVPIYDSPKPPDRRLTLTLPALEGSLVVVAAFGESKAAAIREALTEPASPLPVARAARGARHALFLLDPEAAGAR
jgi:6-phosphogluconolactonase